jgi:hypothetical protein
MITINDDDDDDDDDHDNNNIDEDNDEEEAFLEEALFGKDFLTDYEANNTSVEVSKM